MPFGPELCVIRDLPVQGKVDQITLGAVDPTDMPAFPTDDPSFEYLNPYLAQLLKRGHQAQVLTELVIDGQAVVWGVSVEDRLLGFASVSLAEAENDFCYYSIVLHPNARNHGIGSLATEAVLHTAFSRGSLRSASYSFAEYMGAVGTLIHPDNEVSQRMCERAGFVQIEGEAYKMGDREFLSYLCVKPSFARIATILPG